MGHLTILQVMSNLPKKITIMAEQRGVPYDRGWAWMIVVGYFFSSFIMLGVAKSYGLLMKPLMDEFDVDITIASLGNAVMAGIYTLAAIALVTTHAGYNSASSSGDLTSTTGSLVTIGSATTLFLARSFPSNKVTPSTGRLGRTPTTTAPVFVALGQHFTERSVVMFGAVFACIFISLCYLKIGIWYLIWMYGIGTGIGNSCLYGNGVVMIGSYFKKIRTRANGIALSGASVGTFVIPPLMEFLLQTYGLPGTYLILGGLYLTVAVCGALYRPLIFYTNGGKKEGSDEKHKLIEKDLNDYFTSTGSLVIESTKGLEQVVQSVNSNKQHDSITIKIFGKPIVIPKIFHFSVLKMPEVMFYTIFSFLVFFGYFNFIILMPIDAASRGFASYEKAWLVSCAGIGDLIGRVVVGIVGDLRIIERYKIIGATCIFCGINILIFNFATVFWWCAIHTTLYGFFGGAYVALNSIVLIDMVGLEIMPKAIGVILLIQGLGAAIGQPVEGAIKEATGSFSLLNYINSSLMIIGGCMMFLYPLVKNASKLKDKSDAGQEEEET
ncbi:monocarboxylate transporter 12-like [Mytilus trossulus]|uniref:monocarboxylate transporter 12-like n=1 Tax=Mytilus trossulus TaxID=6551 RepID=UPI003006E015